MSPASGDPLEVKEAYVAWAVSIQLMSPASGDKWKFNCSRNRALCFHSINVPSEWGRCITRFSNALADRFNVSIQLMSPASGDIVWGYPSGFIISSPSVVSIQLMSPASGD
jgi:hypothetical protein